jgi:hypothetical protein
MTSQDSRFERHLRRALRPADPPKGFAEAVMAAVERARSSRGALEQVRSSRRLLHRAWRWRAAWLSTAASVVLAIAGGWAWHRHVVETRALAVRAEVYQALRISSKTLNAALAVAVNPTRPG